MSSVALALRQVKYENKAFWRNSASAFFTFVFPLMLLVIFNLLFGNQPLEIAGRQTTTSTFYVPAIAAFSVITACYTNSAMSVTISRDEGTLKRIRGTPLPPSAFMAGRMMHKSLIALLLVAIVIAFGALFYGVDVQTTSLPALIVTLVVGAAAFCALGLAVSAAIPRADAAPAIVNASVLPLFFISDVFIPLQDTPGWLTRVADVFPVKHYSDAMQTALNPAATGSGFAPEDLAVVAAWGAAGLLVAVRFFSWEPRR